MSAAIPYSSITVRDPQALGAGPGEHEVVFTTGEMPHVQSNVVRLTTAELGKLSLACGERLIACGAVSLEDVQAVIRQLRDDPGLRP